MNDNYNYVLNNSGVNLTNNEWLMYIKNYFTANIHYMTKYIERIFSP